MSQCPLLLRVVHGIRQGNSVMWCYIPTCSVGCPYDLAEVALVVDVVILSRAWHVEQIFVHDVGVCDTLWYIGAVWCWKKFELILENGFSRPRWY